MPPLLVAIPWVGSVVLTGVLCFRLGYWWKTTELQGRHAVGNVVRQDPWDASKDEHPEAAVPTDERPARPTRWWSGDDDTEVLPVVEDDR